MINNIIILPYYEPYDTVISRSGDECVVALCDQWCINYGEPEWKNQVLKHVQSENFTCYFDSFHKMLLEGLDWLREWACSRISGLGTRIPWDPRFLIESLSDSTIYNAYYTIAHLLQGGVLDGTVPGPLKILPKDISRCDWDYIFLGKSYSSESKIEEEKLKAMRHEFEYWYPVDMRSTAKDLIRNHMIMMLYNHAAIWNNSSDKMPRSYFCNGYVMVDGKKMSKQEGNFYTLREILDCFGSDATRLALATAGDQLEDANVEIKFMDDAILRLFTLQEWIEKQLPLVPIKIQESDANLDFYDKMFENDMINLVGKTCKAYDTMRFRDVIKFGFFEFQALKDEYLLLKRSSELNWGIIIKYIEWQLIIMSPIIPHISDYCWRYMLIPKLKDCGLESGKPFSIINSKFPTNIISGYNAELGRISSFLKNIKRSMRIGINKAVSSKNGKKNGEKKKTQINKSVQINVSKEEEGKYDKCLIFVAKDFNDYQKTTLSILNKIGLNEKNELKREIIPELKPLFEKSKLNKAMKFASFCLERAKAIGAEALEMSSPFDEKEVILKYLFYLSHDMPVNSIEIFEISETCPYSQFEEKKLKATPGNPEIFFLQKFIFSNSNYFIF